MAVWTLGPLAPGRARELLEELVERCIQGLEAPLLFFPETSRAYFAAKTAHPGGPAAIWVDQARCAWRPPWAPQGYTPGESQDPHVRRLLGEAEPFAPGFSMPGTALEGLLGFDALATAIWQPLTAALREEPVT